GTLPFYGENAGEVLEAIFTKEPPSPLRLNRNIPSKLEEIIGKALEKDRNLRYQAASDMRTDLQRLRRDTSMSVSKQTQVDAAPRLISKRSLFATLGSVVAILAFILIYRFDREKPKAAPPVAGKIPSIAVLPFVNMSPDKDQEYFSDGLADELLNKLASIRGLHVAGRTSSFAFKGKNEDLRVIGQKLNVGTILEGSVRKSGDRVRITAQLVNTADGFHLWSHTYDRELNDIFAVQDEIAGSVANALQVTLLGNKPASRKVDPQAYNAFLQGQYFRERRSPENLQKAIGYYEEAIKLDPNYAHAWAGLAWAHIVKAQWSYGPIHESFEKARKEAEKALTLDEDLAMAHRAIAAIQQYYDWDWSAAEVSTRRALELEPGSAFGLQRAAQLAETMGQFKEALSLAQRAVEIDPLSIFAHVRLAISLFNLGRLDEAAAELRKVLELHPNRPEIHTFLAVIYVLQSNPEAALKELNQESDSMSRLYGLALAYHALGKKMESDSALADLIHGYQKEVAFQIAEVYAYRGETEKAFEWLDRAYELRDG
ncbi:MAG TPA: tetratricopeptide repeat protein, partial [Acidobacteriota bacterium]